MRTKKEIKAYKKKWYSENRERLLRRMRNHYREHREEYRERSEKYRVENAEKIRLQKKKYYKKNKTKVVSSNIEYSKHKYKNDHNFRLKSSLRKRIVRALTDQGNRKSMNTQELLGETFDFVKSHLESLFQEGMTWENYGYRGWHIDHIVPLCRFDLNYPTQQKKAFNYKNLQPLWMKDNFKKRNHV
jgi:hypothetical protein